MDNASELRSEYCGFESRRRVSRFKSCHGQPFCVYNQCILMHMIHTQRENFNLKQLHNKNRCDFSCSQASICISTCANRWWAAKHADASKAASRLRISGWDESASPYNSLSPCLHLRTRRNCALLPTGREYIQPLQSVGIY